MTQRFGQDLVILHDRSPFEQMLLGVTQRRGGRLEAEMRPFFCGVHRPLPEFGERPVLFWRQPDPLPFLDLRSDR